MRRLNWITKVLPKKAILLIRSWKENRADKKKMEQWVCQWRRINKHPKNIKEFYRDCKKLDDLVRLGRSKTVDFKAMLLAIEANLASNIIISSSSCRAISMDMRDQLSPPLPIVHRFRQILWVTPCIHTELLYVGSSCFWSAIWRGPLEHITYELFPTSPAVSWMSGSSNLDSFRDGW